MLKDEDRIFTNLYNDQGPDISSARKRGIGKIHLILLKKEKNG